jgi:hypothetical protein
MSPPVAFVLHHDKKLHSDIGNLDQQTAHPYQWDQYASRKNKALGFQYVY